MASRALEQGDGNVLILGIKARGMRTASKSYTHPRRNEILRSWLSQALNDLLGALNRRQTFSGCEIRGRQGRAEAGNPRRTRPASVLMIKSGDRGRLKGRILSNRPRKLRGKISRT